MNPLCVLVTYSRLQFELSDIFIFSTGSNHYGIAGWYAVRAAKHGLIVSIGHRFCKYLECDLAVVDQLIPV